jgi:hypothetical protein
MEVTAFALAIPPIIGCFRACIKSIDDLNYGIKTAEPRLDRIRIRCNSLEAALEQLQSLPSRLINDDFTILAATCSDAVKETQAVLQRYAKSVNGLGSISTLNKWRVVWADGKLSRSTERLDDCQAQMMLYYQMVQV